MAYQTLLSSLGLYNGVIYLTPDLFVKGCFMLVFDLTHDGCASDCYTSLPHNGNICIELKFDEDLTEAVTILLYQEYDNCILRD